MLSAINTSIDAVSGVKTQFVKTFVLNEELAKTFHTYIDAQQSFAKDVAKTTYGFLTKVASSAMEFDAKKAFAAK